MNDNVAFTHFIFSISNVLHFFVNQSFLWNSINIYTVNYQNNLNTLLTTLKSRGYLSSNSTKIFTQTSTCINNYFYQQYINITIYQQYMYNNNTIYVVSTTYIFGQCKSKKYFPYIFKISGHVTFVIQSLQIPIKINLTPLWQDILFENTPQCNIHQ